MQKLLSVKIVKLKEFNFKLLNNIVPCGNVLSKWKTNISKYCDVCNEIETTKHMLFDCKRINDIWNLISNVTKTNISWKEIVCGFINYDVTDKIVCLNIISSLIAFSIFKVNSHCKFNDVPFANINVRNVLKENLSYYVQVLGKTDVSKLYSLYLRQVISKL